MKAKAKKIKVPIGAQDSDLSEMFNQILGTGSVNITIAYPRYRRIKGLSEQLIKLFGILADSPFMRSVDFANEKKQIADFVAESKNSLDDIFCADYSDYEWNLTLLPDEQKAQFTTIYENMKKSNLVKTFIILCDRLVSYKSNFADLDKLNPKFITAMNGVEWNPFPFTNLNLKYIFSIVSDNTKAFFMTILGKAYELSRNVYDEIQSPDIDVDQFVDFIMRNIDTIQKRPELHRCKDAFNKIKESVGMLKDRFNGYYRDFIATNDSTIMMQHFIIDVSKNTPANASITQQFRIIIGYYRKLASNQITNPKVKALFDKISVGFKDLEKNAGNLVNIENTDETKDILDSDSDGDEILLTTQAKSAADVESKIVNEAAKVVDTANTTMDHPPERLMSHVTSTPNKK